MVTRNIALALVLLLVCVDLKAQQTNSLIGTWKTNPAKSKTFVGSPATSQTVKYELAGGNAVKYTSERTAADGTRNRIEFTAYLNGSTAPYTGVAGRDAIKIKRIDSNTYQVYYLNRGEIVQINYWIVSPDGKTLTTVSTGVGSDNKVYSRVVVADRQ